MILITGATGHLGKVVIQNLLKHVPASEVAGLVRDRAKASELEKLGVSVRAGDYEDLASLDAAMAGVSRVLLVAGNDEQNRVRQHGNVVSAAKSAGVRFIAYTSRALKDAERSENKLMDGHFRTEDLIQQSGMTYAIFRNGLYMDVLPMFLGGSNVLEKGIHLPAGRGRVSYPLRAELGEGIARVMSQPIGESRAYLLTAHEAWSFDDVAAALSELSGREVPYVPTDKATFEASMRAKGTPEPLIQRIYGFYCDIRDGQLDEVSPELGELLGREPASLKRGLATLFGLKSPGEGRGDSLH